MRMAASTHVRLIAGDPPRWGVVLGLVAVVVGIILARCGVHGVHTYNRNDRYLS